MLKILKTILNELSPNTVFNVIVKYIINIFSIVNNSFPCHPYMFVNNNYYSKFTIMSFWAPVPKSNSENSIPKKSLDTLLPLEQCVKYIQSKQQKHQNDVWCFYC